MNNLLDDTKVHAFNEGYDSYENGDFGSPYPPESLEDFWYLTGWETAHYQRMEELEEKAH